MRTAARKAAEILQVSVGLYAELARSAFRLVPRRRLKGLLQFARTGASPATT